MTTVYKFKAYYTNAGVGTVQDPAPTCTVINMADDSKLADAQATTASTNMPGLYSYEYSGADGLDCVAWFKTTDTGCDIKELASYVSEKITTNLNADVAGVETKLDTVDTNVDTLIAGVTLADDAITSAKFDESTAFPVKSADTGATALARTGADSDTLETLSDQMDAIKTETASILEDTGTDGVVLTAGAVDAILDEVVVGTYTMRQLLTVFASALAGKLSGGGTTTLTFRGINDASDVIVATVDANGNRSDLTITV